MPLVIQSLEKPAPAEAAVRPGSAVVISVGIHALVAAALFFVPLKIVQWSSAKQQGPFEVTLAEEWVSEEAEAEPVPEPVDKPELKKAPAARIASPVEPPLVISVTAQEPEIAAGQLAFVTVPEVFEPSLEFEEEVEEETPESKPPAPKPKPSPAPAKTARKVSSANTKVVSARVIRNPSPVYPASARDKGQQGTAILTVSLSSKGSVSGMRLSKSSGHSLLDAAAQKAVRRWKFAPASRGGIAVASQVRVPIQFRIH